MLSLPLFPLLFFILQFPPVHLLVFVVFLLHILSRVFFFQDTRSTVEICLLLGERLKPEELNLVFNNSSFQAMKESEMSNDSLWLGGHLDPNTLLEGKK